jgi:hypothetical protein
MGPTEQKLAKIMGPTEQKLAKISQKLQKIKSWGLKGA